MNPSFQPLFSKTPKVIEGDYFFDSDQDGDQFDENDAKRWQDGVFRTRWEQTQRGKLYFYEDILRAYAPYAENATPFLEIACGPGMGLVPALLSKYPQAPCLASDACSLLIKSWRHFIDQNLSKHDISLASFSVMDMPLKDESFDVVTSFIGVSSTRSGEQGKLQALREISRVLKKGGCLIAIENEWTDSAALDEVFRLWGRQNWFEKNPLTWPERFEQSGLTVESCDKHFYRRLNAKDNELGEAAAKWNIEIGIRFTLFVVRKAE